MVLTAIALCLGLLAASVIGVVTTATATAAATGDDYPWSDAACVTPNPGLSPPACAGGVAYDNWGYSTCPANDMGCMGLSQTRSGVRYGERDPWGEYLRNCTSAVAWWLHERNGFEMPFHADADLWGTDARNLGYAPDTNPAPGSVAWFQGSDHVAWVEKVNPGNGTVTIEDYNKNYDGLYSRYDVAISSVTGFIHFRDLSIVPPPTTPPTSSPTSQPPPPPAPTVSATAQASQVQGDFNGDGHTDLAAFYDYPDARTVIWVFWGDGTGALSAPTVAWDSGQNNWDGTHVKAFVGDFNHDGRTDIGAFYGYDGATTVLNVFTSQGTTFSAPVGVWNSGAGNWDWNQIRVVAGDFNGDGNTDVAAMYDYGGAETVVFVFAGNGAGGFSAPTGYWNSGPGNWGAGQTDLTAGDVNGDGKTDLIAVYDYGGSETVVFVFYSTGTAFSPPAGQWNSGAGNFDASQSKVVAGDFNGDGRTDLGVVYGAYGGGRTLIFTFLATPSGTLAAPTTAWDSGWDTWDWSRVTPFVGDYNGDGKTDLGVFFAYDNSETAALMLLSNGSTLGNPLGDWDSGPAAWTGANTLVA